MLYRAVPVAAASVGYLQEHDSFPHVVSLLGSGLIVCNLSHWAMFGILHHFQVRSNLWLPDLKVIFFPARFSCLLVSLESGHSLPCLSHASCPLGNSQKETLLSSPNIVEGKTYRDSFVGWVYLGQFPSQEA